MSVVLATGIISGSLALGLGAFDYKCFQRSGRNSHLAGLAVLFFVIFVASFALALVIGLSRVIDGVLS